jgi:hypothetical protein
MLTTAKRDVEIAGIVVTLHHTAVRIQVDAKNVFLVRTAKMDTIVKTTNVFGLGTIALLIRNAQKIGTVPIALVFLVVTIAMKTALKKRRTVARRQADVRSVGLMNIAKVAIIKNVKNIGALHE